MSAKLSLVLLVAVVAQAIFAQPLRNPFSATDTRSARSLWNRSTSERLIQEEALIFPGLLRREELEAGNPLATYAATLTTLADAYAIGQMEHHLAVFPELAKCIETSLAQAKLRPAREGVACT